MANSQPSRALTIAGFDPSGGAGVLADVRTFAALGLQACAAITSITFQNANGVFGAIHQTPEAVCAQIQPLLQNFTISCAKTGMLPNREIVREVVRLFRETDLPSPVVDPVVRSSSGHSLMDEGALDELVAELIPLARLVTPNIPEAEILTATSIASEADMRNAAAAIRKLGARAVLIKGGHLSQGDAIDVLDDEGKVTVFREQRIDGAQLHGSGCILSAAIAAGLGTGMTLAESVGAAKSFVLEALRRGATV
ncbi:MAG TPA: bifunctional hydroxymethylpyrimidine kinase/phosphomethylpyrimidine kinase [Pyrinomonadaceae bacterium]|jgi:hydroxymethylpyrimidine kinase/phosphomethylpyrimidine kinase|nr:bifunctional hydroxymethylpyrimidine kinase/phosphomethylpyrimidine kinase [Pyrinomonadaceae bacterium]